MRKHFHTELSAGDTVRMENGRWQKAVAGSLTARWKPGLRSPQHIEDICLDAFEALSIESIQEASITLLRGKYGRGAGSK